MLTLFRVFEDRLEKYLETDIYGKVISNSVKAASSRKAKRARPDETFAIPEMSRFVRFKKIMDAFYSKSSAYKVRNLQIRPNTFDNRITSFVAAPEFIATGKKNEPKQKSTVLYLFISDKTVGSGTHFRVENLNSS